MAESDRLFNGTGLLGRRQLWLPDRHVRHDLSNVHRREDLLRRQLRLLRINRLRRSLCQYHQRHEQLRPVWEGLHHDSNLQQWSVRLQCRPLRWIGYMWSLELRILPKRQPFHP